MGEKPTTVRLQEELIDRLDQEADDRGLSRSDYIRQILRERHETDELRQEIEQLRDRLETREERVTELEEQLARRSRVEEKVDTLAKQQTESDAPFFVRWYRWWRRRQ
jgi:Arc/MetJ-type ribon-helix-helix transcriptional regulator